MLDEVTLICRVMLPTDLLSLIYLTQFTPAPSPCSWANGLCFQGCATASLLLWDAVPDAARDGSASSLRDASFEI